MLELNAVTFQYAPGQGVNDVTLSVAPGEVVGVVGGNGAGKSTLLGLIAAALVPQEGSVQLAITDLAGRTRRWKSESGIAYRRRVGYLTELAPVYEEMSVWAYLRFRAKLRGEHFLRIKRRVMEAIERCGLMNHRKVSIRRLSYGLRRRVALAEALLTLPVVLVLDDPFAGIDAPLRAEFATIIKDVSARSHVFISGHDPLLLQACCTRFLVVEEGQIVADKPDAATALAWLTEPTKLHIKEKGR